MSKSDALCRELIQAKERTSVVAVFLCRNLGYGTGTYNGKRPEAHKIGHQEFLARIVARLKCMGKEKNNNRQFWDGSVCMPVKHRKKSYIRAGHN